jgi:SnoaL-like polyketide cyclase
MTADRVVDSGNEIVVLGHFRGTHSGDFASPNGTIPASGNPLDLRFIDYFRVEGDKIVDHPNDLRSDGAPRSARRAARLARATPVTLVVVDECDFHLIEDQVK